MRILALALALGALACSSSEASAPCHDAGAEHFCRLPYCVDDAGTVNVCCRDDAGGAYYCAEGGAADWCSGD